MTLNIANYSIKKVSIVDDDRDARSSYGDLIEDLELEPVKERGPLRELDKFLELTEKRSQAAICDHHLRVRNYARFNGARLVALYYRKRFPALLCTKFEDANIDEIRPHRKRIPVLLNPNEMDTDNIRHGFELCIAEFEGRFVASRRPWRTLVRVVDVDEDDDERGFCWVILPGWNSNVVIRLRLKDLHPSVHAHLYVDARLHAQVNIGAETHEDLYFDQWEVD